MNKKYVKTSQVDVSWKWKFRKSSCPLIVQLFPIPQHMLQSLLKWTNNYYRRLQESSEALVRQQRYADTGSGNYWTTM